MELADSKHLQEISTHLIQESSIEALYEKIIDAAVAIMRSDYASMQTLREEQGDNSELHLLAFRGFNPQAAKFWERVSRDSASTCAMGLRAGKRVIAQDVEKCDLLGGSEHLAMYLQTGIRAVQSTPLVSRDGRVVGMISTHWREPHTPTERDLQLFDVLARQAAGLIEHRQAEQAARRAMEFDEAVMSNMGEGLYTVNSEGLVTFMNPATEKLFDWTFEELRGRKMHDVTHYKHRDGTRFPIEECPGFKVLREGKVLNGQEDCFVRKDGSFFDVIYSSAPLHEGGGDGGLVVVFRDITDRKLAETALREREDEYRKLAETLDSEVRVRTRELEQRNAEVLEQARKVQGLSRSLMQVQDDERRHIARELHDSAGQTLTALAMNLARVADLAGPHDPLKRQIAETGQIVQQLT